MSSSPLAVVQGLAGRVGLLLEVQGMVACLAARLAEALAKLLVDGREAAGPLQDLGQGMAVAAVLL